ncbi:MAG: prepilin-type N-terminal cleavage/methylation domain-containing protein [Bacteroidia bacterium]
MAVLNKKINGSTLIETLVAMVIIIICFGIGTVIYSNVINSVDFRQRLHASMVLNEVSIQSKKDNNYVDNDYEIENLVVKKKINRFMESDDLLQMTLSAYNGKGKLIAQHKEVIFIPG